MVGIITSPGIYIRDVRVCARTASPGRIIPMASVVVAVIPHRRPRAGPIFSAIPRRGYYCHILLLKVFRLLLGLFLAGIVAIAACRLYSFI